MSTIYWKFKNTKQEFSSVTFDSTHVSILDLKRAIIKQKKLQQTPQQPFDLSIINAHTGVEYTDETGPIPRNLAVIVRRLPAARNQHKKLWAPLQNNSIIATADNISKKQIQTISERLNQEFGAPIFNDSGGNASSAAVNAEVNQVENETMNIIDMMNRRMNNGTSTTTTTTINTRNNRRDNMRNNRNNDRNHNNNNNNNNNSGDGKDGKQSYRSQRGDPPPGYICHRCHVSGHWIQDCPTNGDPKYDKKNRAQTLRSNLPDSVPKPATPTNISGDGGTTANVGTQQVIIGKKCYQIPTNVYESFKGDHSKIKAYIEISKGTNSSFSSSNTTQGSGEHSKYKCELCHNFYNDARFVPCCHVTYCNECIRQKSLPQNPSMIQCPSCQELFTSDVLNDAKNTKLQEKVDKLLSKLQKESNQHQIPTDTSSAINLNNPQSLTLQPPTTITPQHPNASPNTSNNSSSTQTIQIPHPNQPQQTIHHIPQPVITRTAVRPTVILQQSPPIIPPPTPLQPQVPQAIDTSTFEAPKATFVTGDSAHYTCIECGQRGHKYKDCPKVAERQQQQTTAPMVSEKPALEAASGSSSASGSDSDDANAITNSADIAMMSKGSSDINTKKGGDRKHREQKLTDLEPLGRIPKKTAAEMMPKSSGSGRGSGGGNKRSNNNNNMNLNQNLGGNSMNATSGYHGNHGTTTQQQRVTPQVQLINNSTMGSNYSAMGNINALNSLQQMSMMNSLNVRNRLVNNVLMNAALHNATRRGGIAPRLINSNPLLNPLLNRNPHLLNNINTLNHTAASTNPLSILQQQSLLTQQAALNRLRSNNPLLANTINNNINLNTANINLGGNNSSLHNQPTVNITNTNAISNNARITNTTTNTNTSNAANSSMPNITQDVLTETIQELKQVMTLNASNPGAVTDAINAAFIKLGAKDANAKRIVLEKLVATCGGINGAQQATPQSIDGNNSDASMEKESHSKSKKKKKSKSKSKRSKKKKKDKDRKSSKDKESRRERRKHKKRERERKERRRDRDRSRRDDRDRESGSGRDRDRARKEDRDDRDRSRSRDRGSRSRNKGSSDSDDDNLNDRQLSVSLEPPTQENNNTSTTINTDEVNKNIDDRGNNSSQNVASSGTDFPDPDDEEEENIIHVNVVNENDKSGKKRKLPPAPIPDFAVSPPPPKRQKIASQIPSPSISPTVEDDK